ncbi:Bacillosamine/Legionaminic acid biosynthesis aminotransferase PglE; 4-keto-6-deoxy-N-Acetyl-D-hexosaminyl-(Lipid carrier) aminotransferase [Alloactinosynnema sp. L-07]|uniref:DegT/DnrJ/EryC1/StrS family aminotransferase n=1 Tax=Alloactinosynnema sp. L-07 TaxID=1653480 RepID=UPI00065EF189|nr:DegT/DnrJ/EryC1/StrS aminotransferase family protein [Alloactinosynnema sp. L-07]CRK60333.1 Bacillosamine/Legionaminic acid biosynthesis aminotransferase PglE; 4-keto-6-deoxy-N-Acetyl-D-hexosaminyl-(Lipid carrier) aminotransferase [Alloactinosynnema sp. L-07]
MAIPVMKPLLGEEEALAVAETVRSGWVAQGPRVAAFEQAFAERVGAAHGVAVSSCTTGLHLCLHLLGVAPGDEVVVPSLSFIATANAVRYCGATPVFADIDPLTGNLTGATVAAAITPRTKAVMLVHQGGVPANVREIRAAAGEIPVVEDAACAAGSTLDGAPVGTGALLAAWSFHPRKLLTTGEGGMVTTDDPEWAVRLRRLREHGMSMSAADRHAAGGAVVESYVETAFNYRMTDIQAAMGLVQLGRLDGIVEQRRAMAARYHELLAPLGLRAVADPEHGTTNYQSFWVELPEGAPELVDVLSKLAAAGVSARRGIMAAHLEPAYTGHPHGPLPGTELLARRSLILPLHHELTDADQQLVVSALADAIELVKS